MPNFKPIKQSRVSKEVCDQLKRSILVGHFQPGDKLPSERELAEEFQVSRVAIREALRTLENSGFITTRQGINGGMYVTELTFGYICNAFLDLFLADKISIPELYRVRLLIEPEIARLAALAITPEYAQSLKGALQSEELPTKTLWEDIEMKTAVHYILAEMCGNRFLEAILRSSMKLTHKVIEVVSPNPYTLHPAGMHVPIVKAVLSGDPDAACSTMREHSIEFGQILIKMEKTYREKKSS
ncbi:MAG: GntR family transcriptional regulator [Deltaproteobacteria bacterium RBG_13_47_9]|jgi:DNA-binding FadR family transcriptional regulator|nr:MAG: GntR family transcriptional regulator [Deltaproteobacteria bacterium RBG_13_47_9]